MQDIWSCSALVWSWARNQYSETAGIFFVFFVLRFQTKERVLRVNKSEITSEKNFDGDVFGIKESYQPSIDKNNWF